MPALLGDIAADYRPVVLGPYDAMIMAEPTLLYYFPLGTSAGTEELVANRVLTKNAGTGPTWKSAAMPNGDSCQSLIGTNSVAPSSGYYSRTGESQMGIQSGMVLECLIKRISGTYGPVYPININYNTWNWWIEIDGANWTTMVWAPGGQKCSENQVVSGPLVLNTWYHFAMRVNSTNSVGFNSSSMYINGASQALSQFTQGGMGTPSGNSLIIGSNANGDSGIENYVGKVAIYSSLVDARISAHAQQMVFANRTLVYTGNAQGVVLPYVTNIYADLIGAAGAGSSPGLGGRVQASYPVTARSIGRVLIGNTSGVNGGGAGGSTGAYSGSNGGGATDLRVNGSALADRKIVAGAGGGTGGWSTPAPGGNGGGTTGQTGTGLAGGTGGGGGTPSAGGAGGVGDTTSSPGTLGVGGAAASSGGYTRGGGGGGGGYYGGGGGASSNGVGVGGGGGGSSYADASCVGVTHTQGYSAATGNGSAALAWSTPTPGSITAVGKSASVSNTPSFPASGVQAGDLAVLVTSMEANGTPSYSGWTLLATQGNSGSGTGISITLKVCDGTENGTSLASLGAGVNYTPEGVIYVFRGAVTLQVSLGDNYDTTGVGTTVTFKGVLPNTAGAYLIACASYLGPAPSGSLSGTSPTFTTDFAYTGTSGTPGTMGLFTAISAGAAAAQVTDRTVTGGINSTWGSLMIAVSP